MVSISRFKKALNAYIKNDAKAAAIFSVITDKDYSQQDFFNIKGAADSLVSLIPFLSSNITEQDETYKVMLNYFTQMTGGRVLFIICGSSASGKDTLASYAKNSLYVSGREFSYTRKYTTRTRRGFEGINQSGSHSEPSGNYEYFDENHDFNSINDAVLHYSLYGHKYAFSGEHLDSLRTDDKYQMCIYGKLENIQDIRQKVFMVHKRLPFTILINSNRSDCENRIIRRHSMSDGEQLKRIRETQRQATFISQNPSLIQSMFDLVIDNSDATTVALNTNTLSSFVIEKMDWANEISKLK